MYWYFVFIALIIAFCGFTCYFKKNKINIISINDWQLILYSAIIVAIIIIFLYIIITPIAFQEFETKFELQRQFFEANNNPSHATELIMLNKELFDYQASKIIFGNWSLIPSRALNINPIGY